MTLSALERFSNDLHMLQNCCLVLWDVALVKKFHERLYDADALVALTQVYAKHYSSNDVVSGGITALLDGSS